MDKFPYTAAILAGGQNKRFGGKIKSLQLIYGRSIIDHQLKVLEATFEEVILIANNVQAFESIKGIEIYSDIIGNKGPLSGIHTALYHSKSEAVFVVAGDMPFITSGIISSQASCFENSNCDALVPMHKNGVEPLHGFYSKDVEPKLEEMLANAETISIRGFLRNIRTAYWDVETLQDFVNINTLKDLNSYG